MQAITIAIGQTGIDFFARQFLANKIVSLLQGLNPPDRTIPIDQFEYSTDYDDWTISNMAVQLTNGKMSGYAPSYQSIKQGLNSGIAIFTLTFPAGGFTANYKWTESYYWDDLVIGTNNAHNRTGNSTNSFDYAPSFTGLTVQVIVQLAFNQQVNAWQVTVQSANGNSSGETPNIPGNSVLQNQTTGNCSFSSHVSDATAQAIDGIDFANPINQLISGVLKTIPGSGNLGNGIVYDFSIGDSGLVFPNNDGIQMGVKGGASYNSVNFSGSTPPSLPLPISLTDSDTHHLNMYVSNYEVDALTWAFYKAGQLNTIVNASDLPDPNILKVKTYAIYTPALKPYQAFAMQAQIIQNAAPVTSFQLVYQLTTTVMATLQSQLPSSVYNLLSGLQGNNYTSQASLESDLTSATIASSYFQTIEKAAERMAMVATHNIKFILVIQNFEKEEPTITFDITRVDILGNLSLNVNTNKAQTMQFKFFNATWNAAFLNTTIPNFDGSELDTIWAQAGEPNYDQLLTTLGATGVPLPIMQGFQFDFNSAQLSVQQGYVSIVANVQLTNS